MYVVKVLRGFYDRMARCDREAGDVFETTEGRATQIASRIPGFVEIAPVEEAPVEVPAEQVEEPAEQVDLSSLKVAELKALCAERGIEVPSKATKAVLIGLLEG